VKRLFLMLFACIVQGTAAADETISAAPLFAATLTDVNDRPVTLERYKGRPLVVNFWARWCGPCREEIPDLVAEYARLKGQGLEVLGIALEDKAESVRDFAKAYEMDYPILLAKDQGIPLLQTLGNVRAGLPYTLIIDRQGRIVASRLGPFKKAEMETVFAAAFR
jgi:peroxiredoxin